MSGIMIVDPEMLPKAPAAFQQYVEEFFAERTVLGKKALVASTVLSWDWSMAGYGSRNKGTAPSHSVDLMRFKDGLKEGESLNDWMRKKGEGKFFWQFYDHEPSHSCGACDDD